ncbi:hypothetical protein HID58_063016, partial [Brassica napus]
LGIMKTIFDIPGELLEDEIFSRVPMTSLRSVRSTCRKWNTLCKNRIFFGKETAAKKQFMMMDSRICLMNFDPCNLVDPSIKQVSLLDQIEISKVFQCNGLLLCVLKDCSRLLVWNPYLAQTRWIEPRISFQSSDRFALGHDNNNLNHKILRISDEHHPITKSFGPLLPLPFQSEHGGVFTSLSCVREDQLAVLYQHWEAQETVEISVTDKIGPNVVSWTKAKACRYQTAHLSATANQAANLSNGNNVINHVYFVSSSSGQLL